MLAFSYIPYLVSYREQTVRRCLGPSPGPDLAVTSVTAMSTDTVLGMTADISLTVFTSMTYYQDVSPHGVDAE